MKRRALSLLLCAVMTLSAAVCFAACGKGGRYIGRWEAVKANYYGMEYSIEDIGGEELRLEIKPDGTALITIDGEEVFATWEREEDGVKLYLENDSTLKVKEKDFGSLSLKINGVELILERR